MPNNGHVWTPDEEAACLELTWDEFSELYNGKHGYDISYDAFRIRKAMLKKGKPAVIQSEPIEVSSAEGEYVGLHVGWWDLETTFSNQPRILCGSVADAWGNVTTWRGDEIVGKDAVDDGPLANEIARALEKFDVIFGWNSVMFDESVLQGRLMYANSKGYDYPRFRPQMHKDLMYLASGRSARIGRRSLASVSEFFSSPNRKTPLSVRTWDLAVSGDKAAFDLIVEHNVADVLVTRDVFRYLKPSITVLHR